LLRLLFWSFCDVLCITLSVPTVLMVAALAQGDRGIELVETNSALPKETEPTQKYFSGNFAVPLPKKK
jgi:hypothetical protein